MEFADQDACVLISLHRQCGTPPERIASTMATRARNDANLTSCDFVQPTDGAVIHGSPAGTIADELVVPPTWADDAAETAIRPAGKPPLTSPERGTDQLRAGRKIGRVRG